MFFIKFNYLIELSGFTIKMISLEFTRSLLFIFVITFETVVNLCWYFPVHVVFFVNSFSYIYILRAQELREVNFSCCHNEFLKISCISNERFFGSNYACDKQALSNWNIYFFGLTTCLSESLASRFIMNSNFYAFPANLAWR